MREAAERTLCQASWLFLLSPAAAPDDHRDPGPALPLPRHHVSPSGIDAVREGKDIAISLRNLDLVSVILLLHPDKPPGVTKASAYGEVNRIATLVVLVGVEVAPVAAVAVEIHQRPNHLDAEELRHPPHNGLVSGRTADDVVISQANLPGELHACVEPASVKVKLHHQPVEDCTVLWRSDQAGDEEGLVQQRLRVRVGPPVQLGDAVPRLRGRRRQPGAFRVRLGGAAGLQGRQPPPRALQQDPRDAGGLAVANGVFQEHHIP
mmetsp:Transcript_2105/g.6347  ORF Transcript_2105/g.6347 Transcript_2105/m.6347 type:complete len:264 (+) Transcript_2105:243-1034(+)